MTTIVNITCTVSGDITNPHQPNLSFSYSGGAPYLLNSNGDLDFSQADDDIEVTITLVNGALTPEGEKLQFDKAHDRRNFWVRAGNQCPDRRNRDHSIFHKYKVSSGGEKLSFNDKNTPNNPPDEFSYALRVKDSEDNWYINDPTIKNR